MISNTPPKALERQIILEDHKKVAFKQIFELPDGKRDSWFLFGSSDKPIIIFPLTKQNEVVTLEHFRYGANTFIHELPGGGIQGDFKEWHNIPDSIIIENARRELEEETGYSSDDIVQIGPPTWFDPASLRVTFLPILARNCFYKCEPHPDRSEVFRGDPKKVLFEKWIEMIRGSDICDSKSIAITLMVLCYQNQLHILNSGFDTHY